MVLHSENKVVIPLGLGIWLISLIVVIISHLSSLDFGLPGILAWIIVIVGAIYFILSVLLELS